MGDKDIFCAIIAGDLASVEHHVNSVVDLEIQDVEGLIPICRAIRNGELAIASLLLKNAELAARIPVPITSRLRWKAFEALMKLASVLLSFLFNLTVWYLLCKLCPPLQQFDSHLQQPCPFLFAVNSSVEYRLLIKLYNYIYQSFYPCQEKQTPVRRLKNTLRMDTTGLTHTAVEILEEVLQYGGDMESFMLELLDSGFPIGDTNRPYGPGAYIWIWAVKKGYHRVLQKLAERKIDVNVTLEDDYFDRGRMTLSHAVSSRHLDCVEYHLKIGANPNGKHVPERASLVSSDHLPIILAARSFGSSYGEETTIAYDILAMLLTSGADPNSTTSDGRSVLSLVAGMGCNLELLKLLLDSGSDAQTIDQVGRTALHFAASSWCNNLLVVNFLLAAGCSAVQEDNTGMTPVKLAAEAGCSLPVLQRLLDTPEARDTTSGLLLPTALMYCGWEMADFLLSRENPNQENDEGDCALFTVMQRTSNPDDWVRYLLEHGARANFATASGMTGLHYLFKSPSYIMKKLSLAQILVKYGANLNAKRTPTEIQKLAGQTEGITPLADAEEYYERFPGFESPELIPYLREAQSEVD
ncbi:hypothetical protein MMC16_004719 [Acarospora aff. strigata]|nr:hypothetical protein [Acarospora aff. strigata]